MALRFEDLESRKTAETMTLLIYKSLQNCSDFGFNNQIQRASLSVMNNIAEGYERIGTNDKKKYIVIEKGSCAEVRSMLHIGIKLGYFSQELYDKLMQYNQHIGKLLHGLIKKLMESG